MIDFVALWTVDFTLFRLSSIRLPCGTISIFSIVYPLRVFMTHDRTHAE
jgi:hypothetical protein